MTRKAQISFFSFLFSGLFLFSSCVKNNSFISASKLKSKLQGEWHLQPLMLGEAPEVWIFGADGSLVRTDPAGVILDQGSFSVNAKLYNSRLVMIGMGEDRYNGRWLIVNISNSVLQLNIPEKCADGARHCGTWERELYR